MCGAPKSHFHSVNNSFLRLGLNEQRYSEAAGINLGE